MFKTVAGDVEPPAGEDEEDEEGPLVVVAAEDDGGCECVLDILSISSPITGSLFLAYWLAIIISFKIRILLRCELAQGRRK